MGEKDSRGDSTLTCDEITGVIGATVQEEESGRRCELSKPYGAEPSTIDCQQFPGTLEKQGTPGY